MASLFVRPTPKHTATTALAALIICASNIAGAQETGSSKLHELVNGATTTARVLIVGSYPGDEDSNLIAYLTRGAHAETAYLSITRGESQPNAIGSESGEILGAIRVQEALAARRIDGARQFFTRAFDFGTTRNTDEVFEQWPREDLVGDVVSVLRAFRPHVILVADRGRVRERESGAQQATLQVVREAFDAAADTTRFAIERYGFPWLASRLLAGSPYGAEYLRAFDVVAGKTYSEIASASRLQLRSTGRASRSLRFSGPLQLLASHTGDTTFSEGGDILLGVDTSFTRLTRAESNDVASALALVAQLADSARATLDLARPGRSVTQLADLVKAVSYVWENIPHCRHPAIDLPRTQSAACSPYDLDVEASVDVMRRRAIDALLIAAAVRSEVNGMRELLAYGDGMPVSVNITNHGTEPIEVRGVHFGADTRMTAEPVTLAPGQGKTWTQFISGLTDTHPHWMSRRLQEMFEPSLSPVDGLARVGAPGSVALVASTAIPEDYRRTSDLSVSLTIAGASFTTSLGPVMASISDPNSDLQRVTAGGVPPVTLSFGRSLEWFPANRNVDRVIGLSVQSFSDSARTFALRIVAPPGITVDSLPDSVTLASRERRELLLRVRGRLEAGRYEFGVIGSYENGAEFAEGFREIRYPHIPPVRSYRQSGFWLQSVELGVPEVVVAYVRGAGDGIPAALTQLGIRVNEIDVSQLAFLDLARFTTIVLAPNAHIVRAELTGYHERLKEFVEKGGTLVVQYSQATNSIAPILPYQLAWSTSPERVNSQGPEVDILDARNQVLNWPNQIATADWRGWVRGRAMYMPSLIDSQYVAPLAMNDEGERPNRGPILMARIGRGTIVYTTIAFDRQMAGGVPGSARLLVNLLAAGQRQIPAAVPAGTTRR